MEEFFLNGVKFIILNESPSGYIPVYSIYAMNHGLSRFIKGNLSKEEALKEHKRLIRKQKLQKLNERQD